MIKILYITNIPAPYRQQELIRLAKVYQLLVLYESNTEKNREWTSLNPEYHHNFIKFFSGSVGSFKVKIPLDHLHFFFKHSPEVIVIGGFNFISLSICLMGWLLNKKIIYNTDATIISESHISAFKKRLRFLLLSKMGAVIAKSISGIDYYKFYKVNQSRIFLSHYVPTMNFFHEPVAEKNSRTYDLVFSGQFIDRKNPDFFCRVCELIRKRRQSLCVLLIGSGPKQESMIESLNRVGATVHYPGFVQPEQLPKYYKDSKILVFPTSSDGWGLTANEAALMGTVVLISPYAGAANDLIISGKSGFVLDLVEERWSEVIINLLDNVEHRWKLSEQSRAYALTYNIEKTIKGFEDAVTYATSSSEKA